MCREGGDGRLELVHTLNALNTRQICVHFACSHVHVHTCTSTHPGAGVHSDHPSSYHPDPGLVFSIYRWYLHSNLFCCWMAPVCSCGYLVD